MASMLREAVASRGASAWLPWLLVGVVLLYFVGYVDGTVHAAAIGSPVALDYVHEFFHHARHVAMMCH